MKLIQNLLQNKTPFFFIHLRSYIHNTKIKNTKDI